MESDLILNLSTHLSQYLTESLIWTDIKQKCVNTDDRLPTKHQEDLMIF